VIQVRPRDLIALKERDRYYYFVVLTKQIMLGGHLVFAFHRVSAEPLPASSVLPSKASDGFHCITDFIAAKRTGSIARLASNVDVAKFDTVTLLRQDSPNFGRDNTWAIWDRHGNLVSCPASLTPEEMSYPVFVCSLHHRACDTIDATQQRVG
jgi:hypothetical protein